MTRLFFRSLAVLTPRERRQYLVGLLGDAAVSAADVFFLALLFSLIGHYSGEGRSRLLPPGFALAPATAFALFTLAFVAKNLWAQWLTKRQFGFSYGVAARLAATGLEQYLGDSYANHVRANTAIVSRRIEQLTTEFCHHLLSGFRQAVTQAVLVVLALAALLLFRASLFLGLFLLLLPPVALAGWWMKRRLRAARASIRHLGNQSQRCLHEALQGYVETNLYGKKDFFTGRYRELKTAFNGHLARVQTLQSATGRTAESFALVGLCLLFVLLREGAGLLTLAAFAAAAYKILPGVVRVLNLLSQARTYAYTLGEMPLPAQAAQPAKAAAGRLESVTFTDVYFSYRQGPLLQGLDFRLERGDFVGLQGTSGRGKTTLINLLLGFLSPGAGTIRINDAETDARERQGWWPRIAYVKQTPFLLHDSVASNICFGEAAVNGEQLQKAVRAAGAEVPDEGFSAVLEKEVTEAGRNVSGGQRQRLALARALYREADLLILDEPFNELDEASEAGILQYCRQLAGEGRIVLLVTHNKNSFRHCNKMITLHD